MLFLNTNFSNYTNIFCKLRVSIRVPKIFDIRVQKATIRTVNPCSSVSIRVPKIFVKFVRFVFKNNIRTVIRVHPCPSVCQRYP